MTIHTSNPDHMTEEAIVEEIKRLEAIDSNGKLTVCLANRLSALRTALERIRYISSGKTFLE